MLSLNHSLTRSVLACAAAALLTGCGGNITGLVGAREDFGCPASGGINCTTVTATYEREHAQDKAAQSALRFETQKPAQDETSPRAEPVPDPRIRERETAVSEPVAAKRSVRAQAALQARASERLVMLWVLPWVDSQGDLHSDSRVWMRVQDALWRIESVRTRAMQNAPETAP